MKRVILITVMLLMICAAAVAATNNCDLGTTPVCTNDQTIKVSGDTGAVYVGSNGGMALTLDIVPSGNPTTLTVNVYGCGGAGSCGSIPVGTSTATTAGTIGIQVDRPYTKYKVVGTWAGGTNVSVRVVTQITLARRLIPGLGTDGSGGATGKFSDLAVRNQNISIGNSSGISCFGHSFCVGAQASAMGDGTFKGYFWQVKKKYGPPYLNMGISGAMVSEVMYYELLPSAKIKVNVSGNPLFLVDLGTNEYTRYGNDATKQGMYRSGLTGVLTYLLIPSKNATANRAQPAANDYTFYGWSTSNNGNGCARAGTDNNSAIGWAVHSTGAAYSHASNTPLTCTIITNGGPILVVRQVNDGSAATATVTLDGISKGTVSGAPPVASLSLNNHAYTFVTDEYSVAAGTHVITYTPTTVGADEFYVTFLSTPPPVNVVKQRGAPRVGLFSVPKKYNDVDSTITTAYDQINQDVVAKLRSWGLNVTYVNMRERLDPVADMNLNDVHPNDSGHAKYADAIVEYFPPTPSADESATFGAMNGFLGTPFVNEYTFTLSTSGTTTDSVENMVPANSFLLPVQCAVNTTITTAANWSVGTPVNGTLFCGAQTGLTSGTQVGCPSGTGYIAAAAKGRITTNVAVGAGKVHCVWSGWTMTPPTL